MKLAYRAVTERSVLEYNSCCCGSVTYRGWRRWFRAAWFIPTESHKKRR